MNPRKLVFPLVVPLVLLLGTAALAATLEELTALALKHRDLNRQYEAVLAQREADIQKARSAFYPSVDLGYAANRLNEATLLEAKENHQVSATASVNLFSGFRDVSTLDASRSQYRAAEYELAGVRQDIANEVAQTLLQVYRNRAYLEVRENSVKLYRERYEEARVKLDVGVLKKADVLKIKVVMDDALQGLRAAEAEVSKSLNRLTRATGLESAPVALESLDFSPYDALPTLSSADEYRSAMMERRADLNALGSLEAAAAARVTVAKAALYPRANLAASYAHAEDDYLPGTGDEDEDETRLQLSVNLNVFDGFGKYADIRKAGKAREEISHRLAERRLELGTELDNILKDVQVAFDNHRVAQTSLAEAEENLRINELSFQQGVATSTDILDAIFYLSQARFNVIDARTNIFTAYYTLLRLIEGFSLSAS